MANEYIVEINDKPTITLDGWNVRCDNIFIQREQITRCKNCRYFMQYWQSDYCDYFYHEVHPFGYCAWGDVKRSVEK